MARFPLDGRNALHWSEAYDRFVLMSFGQMHEACKLAAVKELQGGLAFLHITTLIYTAGDELTGIIISDRLECDW